jgi:nucleoside-diphosphate-sugar epimerase
MRAFITGVASFIGQELLRQCDAKNIEIFGIDLVDIGLQGCHVGDILSPSIGELIK